MPDTSVISFHLAVNGHVLLTWFWHCPLVTQKSIAGLGRLPDANHVGSKHTELVQVSTRQTAHLWKRADT